MLLVYLLNCTNIRQKAEFILTVRLNNDIIIFMSWHCIRQIALFYFLSSPIPNHSLLVEYFGTKFGLKSNASKTDLHSFIFQKFCFKQKLNFLKRLVGIIYRKYEGWKELIYYCRGARGGRLKVQNYFFKFKVGPQIFGN